MRHLRSVDGFFSMGTLKEMIEPERLKGLGLAVAAGGGSLVAATYGMSMIPWVKDLPWWGKSLASLGIGFVGGNLLWNKNRALAGAVAATFGGLALSTAAKQYAGITQAPALSALPEEEQLMNVLRALPEDEPVAVSFQSVEASERLALADVSVDEEEFPGLDGVDVEEQDHELLGLAGVVAY